MSQPGSVSLHPACAAGAGGTGRRTPYLDQPLLQQGAVHAARNHPGQLQGAVPAADPPLSSQAVAARPGHRGHQDR
jgi:hypothetical protein